MGKAMAGDEASCQSKVSKLAEGPAPGSGRGPGRAGLPQFKLPACGGSATWPAQCWGRRLWRCHTLRCARHPWGRLSKTGKEMTAVMAAWGFLPDKRPCGNDKGILSNP